MTEGASILVVDDDALVTSALNNLFLLETEYDVAVFNDPAAALREAERRPFDLILSDFLMPGVNGVELLKRVSELQPDIVRILLTGFADKENAIRAINEVGLYHYLEKPWDNENLLLLIRNALAERGLRRKLRAKVAELERLIQDHASLSDRHQSLERELARAAAVQRDLLPKELPLPDGFEAAAQFEPSQMLGGDFYDACRRGDGAVVFLVADVSGHGTHAALSSMLLKSVFHDAARRADSPQGLLQEMNGSLYRFLPEGMYACAAAAWFPPDGSPCLANAGLPRPFVVRSSGRVDELPLTGMPLGMFEQTLDAGYDCRSVELEPGDLLLLASDGLGDVRAADGCFFQDDGLMSDAVAALAGRAPRAALNDLLESAAAFAGDRPFPDDVTLLALRKRSRDGTPAR